MNRCGSWSGSRGGIRVGGQTSNLQRGDDDVDRINHTTVGCNGVSPLDVLRTRTHLSPWSELSFDSLSHDIQAQSRWEYIGQLYVTKEISVVCLLRKEQRFIPTHFPYQILGKVPRRHPPESSLAYRPISLSTPKVQANNEDPLPPDLIAVSISTSHLRGDVRMDARKREWIARGIPSSGFLFEDGCWRSQSGGKNGVGEEVQLGKAGVCWWTETDPIFGSVSQCRC